MPHALLHSFTPETESRFVAGKCNSLNKHPVIKTKKKSNQFCNLARWLAYWVCSAFFICRNALQNVFAVKHKDKDVFDVICVTCINRRKRRRRTSRRLQTLHLPWEHRFILLFWSRLQLVSPPLHSFSSLHRGWSCSVLLQDHLAQDLAVGQTSQIFSTLTLTLDRDHSDTVDVQYIGQTPSWWRFSSNTRPL